MKFKVLQSMGSQRVRRGWVTELNWCPDSGLPWWLICLNNWHLGLIPGSEDPLEEGMATHFSILSWSIPWTGESGKLWSIGSQRVGPNWNDLARMHIINFIFSSPKTVFHGELVNSTNKHNEWLLYKCILHIPHRKTFPFWLGIASRHGVLFTFKLCVA